jgi:hypothetical protein
VIFAIQYLSTLVLGRGTSYYLNMETTYTVKSKRDGWEVEVFDGVAVELAQRIADGLGMGVDYIEEKSIGELMVRVWAVEDEG